MINYSILRVLILIICINLFFGCLSFTKREHVAFNKCFDECEKKYMVVLRELGYTHYKWDDGAMRVGSHCYFKCRAKILESRPSK